MCGICGVHGPHPDPYAATRAMMDALAHRGPDGRGRHAVGASTLGHTRLAIVDPDGGAQPHVDAQAGTAVAANGEIYNHRKLRARLGEARFASGVDTEAVLRLYGRDPHAFADELDGMYALAASDGHELVLARDPLGIKPLYRARHPSGAVLFASEMKALDPFDLPIAPLVPGVAWRAGPDGAARDGGGSAAPAVPSAEPVVRDARAAARAVRQALDRAVRKRLMSDVPLGAFLSGGLDSSAIAALARPHVHRLHTFSVGVPGSPDLRAARRVADHLDTDHHELTLDPREVGRALAGIVRALESFDVDLIRSCVPTDATARLAARHVKVILTGEGADELFGGYAYHAAYHPDALAPELTRSLRTMHDVNLQRVDRMTMRHGLEGRVPFLDGELVALAQRIDPRLKVRDGRGEAVEKWILREAVRDLLPASVVERHKAQFDEGSGSTELLAVPGGRSAEAQRYRRLFDRAYAHPERLAATVRTWAADRAATGFSRSR